MAAHTHVRQTKHEVCEVTAGKKTQESLKTKRKDDRRHNNTKCKKGGGSLRSYEQDTQEAAVPCEHSTVCVVCSEHRHQTDETDERCSR